MRTVLSTSGRTSWRTDSSYSETANSAPTGCSSTSASRPASASRVGVSPKAKFSSVGHIVRARKQLADARLAVSAGTPDLLRVRLEALRQVVVVDVANVRLVDPHPERDRRDHDPLRRARPPLLHRDALLGAHAGVVRHAPADPRRRAARRSATTSAAASRTRSSIRADARAAAPPAARRARRLRPVSSAASGSAGRSR